MIRGNTFDCQSTTRVFSRSDKNNRFAFESHQSLAICGLREENDIRLPLYGSGSRGFFGRIGPNDDVIGGSSAGFGSNFEAGIAVVLDEHRREIQKIKLLQHSMIILVLTNNGKCDRVEETSLECVF